MASGGRKNPCAGGIRVWRAAADEAENLSVPKPLLTGTGAIHQECLMHSRFSAPQSQCVQHFD